MDLAIKFWKKWLEEDSLKRQKLLENMMITRELVDYNYNKCNKKISKRKWMHMVTQSLDGIFQDLVETIDYLGRRKQKKVVK
jgi:hypothetical protein